MMRWRTAVTGIGRGAGRWKEGVRKFFEQLSS